MVAKGSSYQYEGADGLPMTLPEPCPSFCILKGLVGLHSPLHCPESGLRGVAHHPNPIPIDRLTHLSAAGLY